MIDADNKAVKPFGEIHPGKFFSGVSRFKLFESDGPCAKNGDCPQKSEFATQTRCGVSEKKI